MIEQIRAYLLQALIPEYRKVQNYAGMLSSVFVDQKWRFLIKNCRKGTTAIDMGAFIGDTAIYLAMCTNIKKVYAYEPYPYLAMEAKRNIARSGLGSKIRFFNAKIGDKKGFVRIRKSTMPNFNHMAEDEGAGGMLVPIVRLSDILKGKRNVIIKCSVIGNEHEIFTPALNLDNVYRIEIQYSFGTQSIPQILRAKGFRVTTRRMQKYTLHGEVGWINAEKKR
jgi:FkbM family methyltransferase